MIGAMSLENVTSASGREIAIVRVGNANNPGSASAATPALHSTLRREMTPLRRSPLAVQRSPLGGLRLLRLIHNLIIRLSNFVTFRPTCGFLTRG